MSPHEHVCDLSYLRFFYVLKIFMRKANLWSFELISLIALLQCPLAVSACRLFVSPCGHYWLTLVIQTQINCQQPSCLVVWHSTTDCHVNIFSSSKSWLEGFISFNQSSITSSNFASSFADEASKWRHALPDPRGDSGWDQTSWHQPETETVAHEWCVHY